MLTIILTLCAVPFVYAAWKLIVCTTLTEEDIQLLYEQAKRDEAPTLCMYVNQEGNLVGLDDFECHISN